MTPALDPRFPCLSPESTSPALLPRAAIVDELRRELRHRHNAYPRRVDKGRMSQMDADWEIEAMAAILGDFECDLLPFFSAEERQARRRAAQAIRPFGWGNLVACLRREILLRRRYYPDWVAKGTLDEGAARHQLERLEAAHVHYWVYGRNFWAAELGDWRCTMGGDGPLGARFEPWRDALHAHKARFQPGAVNHAGLYLPDQGAIQAQMPL